ncbi:Zinc metalloproteinase nas-15 [Armadillidium nasatum]|uniref:Metalloendopeptidase n=1 Tax=Armadillidium nasatum TaxID=96803 RepID=A0A5N5T1G6_9CRUS|nr:Zinc metalloproteinase nas-15 [Armadillidium nasatum]
MHELMHSTGFWHEHSRGDRDDYIEVIWTNIRTGMKNNFDKYDWSTIQSLGVEYDLGSIMHYGPYAFAKDRSKPTIIPKRKSEIGQRRNYSVSIFFVRVLYPFNYMFTIAERFEKNEHSL